MRQTVAAAKPTVVTPAEANGQLALRFDGVDDYLQSIDTAASWLFTIDGTGLTQWAVWVVRNVVATQQIFGNYTAGATTGGNFGQQGNIANQAMTNNAGAFTTAATFANYCIAAGEVNSLLFTYKEGIATPEYEMRSQCHLLAKGDSATPPGTNVPGATLNIGRRANGSNFLQADLLEAAIWSTPITRAQRVALGLYSLDRYAAT